MGHNIKLHALTAVIENNSNPTEASREFGFFFFFGVQNIADDLFAIITKSFGQFQTKQGTIFFHGFDP